MMLLLCSPGLLPEGTRSNSIDIVSVDVGTTVNGDSKVGTPAT